MRIFLLLLRLAWGLEVRFLLVGLCCDETRRGCMIDVGECGLDGGEVDFYYRFGILEASLCFRFYI
jgi:hypothetical protein